MANDLLTFRLGRIEYEEGWRLQRELVALRHVDAISDTLLLLQHPPTYTLGRRGKAEHILLTHDELARRNIAVHNVDRGGDVTYHGPGQLVGYPILRLGAKRVDYLAYIRKLERALCDAVRDLGIDAGRQDRFSGVWVGDEKVCALGVKVDSAGVTSHGFALNVNVDLDYFAHIVPCGLADKGVTSLHTLLRRPVSMAKVSGVVVRCVGEAFGLRPRFVSRRQLPRFLESVA